MAHKRPNGLLLLASIVALFAPGCASRANPSSSAPRDNLALMDEAVDRATEDLLSDLPVSVEAEILVCAADNHPHARYLQDSLVRTLLDRELRARVCEADAGSEPYDAWGLSVELLELRLRYETLGGFWGSGRTRREAAVEFSATLSDSLGEVRLAQRHTAAIDDTVYTGSLEELERGPFRPTRADDSAPGLIEPVIAAAVAVGMSYLLIGTHTE
ncbi:MAG: hypothetical protein CME06_00380 [Gemmatimonadetes bacterium]|nr:hypothetical protein [Gemmatimonadota bacterium]